MLNDKIPPEFFIGPSFPSIQTITMLIDTKGELKFNKYFRQCEFKFNLSTLQSIKNQLSNQVIKKPLMNPFATKDIPKYNKNQVALVILYMGRQMEQVNFRNLDFLYLEPFLLKYRSEIIQLLSSQKLTCNVFCLSVCKYLQEYIKANELTMLIQKIKASVIVDILLSAFEQLRESDENNKKIAGNTFRKEYISLFQGLIGYSSAKFIKETSDQDLNDDYYIEKAIRISSLLMEYAQHEYQFGAIRDFVHFTSHHLIFNNYDLQPVNFHDFCFNNFISTGKSNGKHNQKINSLHQTQFFCQMGLYIKLDPEYLTTLVNMVRILLKSQIQSELLIIHFKVLILIIREKLFPDLKKKIYNILLENRDKKIQQFVDRIYQDLLTTDPDLTNTQSQCYNLQLAELGSERRKIKFVEVYYYSYLKNKKKLASETINFIFDMYLEELIDLEQFQAFLGRQANSIKTPTMNKLHSIISQKKQDKNLSFLETILRKKLDSAVKRHKEYVQPISFVHHQWLEAAVQCPPIYEIYLKILVEMIGSKTIEIKPHLININSCVIQVERNYFESGLQYYLTLLKYAKKMEVFSEKMFKYMIVCQSLFGESLEIKSYQYFHKQFEKMVGKDQVDEILFLLQYLVRVLKNTSSVLLYLQAILEFQRSEPQFIKKKVYQIQFLTTLVEDSKYFEISTYSIEAFTILLQLSLLISEESFQRNCKKIMKKWSYQMNRSECNNLCYLFCFREIKNIFPYILEKQNTNNKDRVNKLRYLILDLLDVEFEQEEYLKTRNNKINIEWKNEEIMKEQQKSIKLELDILRNINMNIKLNFNVVTSTKVFSVEFNNERCCVFSRFSGQENKQVVKQISVKELKKNPESIHVVVNLEGLPKNKNPQFHLVLVILGQPIEVIEDGSLQGLQITGDFNSFFENISLTNLDLGQNIKAVNDHLTSMKRIEIGVKSLQKVKLVRFLDKFDFERMYCVWGEMMKHFKQCNPLDGFQMFIELSFRLFKYLFPSKPHKKIPNEIVVMKAIFGTLQKAFQYIRIKAEVTLDVQSIESDRYAYYLYHLFVSAFLPKEFWYLFSAKTQSNLLKLLANMIKNHEFNALQNQNFDLFQQLCEIVDEHEEVIEIIDSIILSHQVNTFLSLKFSHYICKTEQKNALFNRLPKLLGILVDCISSENEQKLKNKILCKFLITQTSSIEVIFLYCPIKSKISLIHFILYSPTMTNIIKTLVAMMKKEQKNELIGLLIVQLQKDSMPKLLRRRLSNSSIEKSIITDRNDTTLHTQLYLVTKLWQEADGQNLSDLLTVLLPFLTAQSNETDTHQFLFVRTQNTICNSSYCQFLASLKDDLDEEKMQFKEDLNLIYELSWTIIVKSEKKKFLTFMTNYLRIAPKSIEIACFPLRSENFKEMSISNQTVILQYIYELLILLKYQYIFIEDDKNYVIEKIFNYIESFVINIEHKNEIIKPLSYVFPKLFANKEPLDLKKLKSKFKTFENCKSMELKGGIYFKIILIVLELMLVNINTNFSKIIELLLFKNNTKSITPRQQVSNTHGAKSQKLPFERQLLEVEAQHRKYFKDMEDTSLLNIKQNQVDLSSSLYQFFIMRLCQFLQNYAGQLEEQILISYSSLVLKELDHPKINKELSQMNCPIYHNKLEYQELRKFLDEISSNSPESGFHRNAASYNPNFSPTSRNQQFLQPPAISQIVLVPPSASPQRRLRRGSSDPSMSKLRNEILEKITKNPKEWGNIAKDNNFSTFFSTKCKQIRLKELSHIHYLLNREIVIAMSTNFTHESELKKFVKLHNRTCKHLINKIDSGALQSSMRKVKKIYPYTSPNKTVVRIMDNCFGNMATPISQRVSCKDYSIKRLRHQQSMNLRRIEEEKQQDNQIELMQEPYLKEVISQFQTFQDEFIQSPQLIKDGKQYCQFVTRDGVYFCNWELSERQLKLKPQEERPSYKQNNIFIYGTPEDNLIKKQTSEHIFLLDQIKEIFVRKFSQMYNSIQIFMHNGTSKFICFYTKRRLISFFKFLSQIYSGIAIIKDPVKEFSLYSYTDQWVEGTLSNFDYLMVLNKFSGRTHNDVNQYYIFPWILKDYQSERIDLTDHQIFRDLSKPMGALNPEKLKRFKDIYKGNGGSHFYGSHYSTSLFILYYLVRIQPFTTLHRDMQQGFDLADRLFNQIYQVWDTLMSESSTSDIKELIPQFFYMPAFLKNIGNIEFGQKMEGSQVNDVVLPPWASSAEEFIITMRAALESDFVSENLHLWIDLIFGKYQCSEEKFNVFLPTTYEEKLQEKWKDLIKNTEELKGTMDQITYFGQCPTRLFNKQHKPKKIITEMPKVHRASWNKKELSHTTSSQLVCQEAYIPAGWKINHIYNDSSKFYLQLETIVGKKELSEVSVQSCALYEEIKLSLEDIKIISKSRVQNSKMKQQDEKIKLDKTELKVGNEVIMSLEMNFSFEQVKLNDMWIICFGRQGIRIYNWLQELFWKWQKQQVSFVFLEPTRLIFCTPSGKLCFYNLLNNRYEQTQAIRECSSMEVKVLPMPRLPSRFHKNQIQYRILCVGDGKKVTLLTHFFDENQNKTSRESLTAN